jgi:biotin--protein ligase
MRYILVYADQGVDGGGLKQLIQSLKVSVDHNTHIVKRIDANALLSSEWEKESSLLIIPGGRDLFYHALLDGKGTERIRAFVENGGSYLGICAGAYFASSSILFEKGGPLEVTGKRSLQFFPGCAIGPAYGPNKYSYESARGVEAAAISWKGSTSRVYFNGGCFFEPEAMPPEAQVLSRYLDLPQQPPAILQMGIGKGKAILSGVHVEYSPYLLNQEDPHLARVLPLLKEEESARSEIFRSLLDELENLW